MLEYVKVNDVIGGKGLLRSKQLVEIKELQKICESGETFQLKLNWDLLKSRPENETNDFLHYENEKLVGFLGIYGFGSKVELCGMVHPDFRRRGIFTNLFHSAEKVMSERGYKKILLNAPSNSESAKGFLKTIPCTFEMAEHQMQWHEKQLTQHEDVHLRSAVSDDLETEAQLDTQCFGFEIEDARRYNSEPRMAEDHYYMIDWDGKTVGKLRVSHNDGQSWIYGFAILPEFQGRGIGRKVLTNVIIQETQAGYPVFLEVEAKNANALRLYESCGFQSYHSQDYYRL